MQLTKLWWPMVASSLVLAMGVLLFLADQILVVDWNEALVWRSAYVLAQAALAGAAIYGAARADVYRMVLIVVAVTDVAIGLGFSAAGWIRIDELVAK
jgi:hypothetical protein